MSIEIKNVSKYFNINRKTYLKALSDVSMSIHQGEFLCLLGPSGCGKSTLLRLIAGIETPTKGEIRSNGKVLKGLDTSRGFVFQEYSLFHWRTVRKNIQFGLENKGISRQEQNDITDHYLDLVGLTDVANAYPSQISGGMKQRVALARALCLKPETLLMDEPFGALDAMTRLKLQDELIRVYQKEKITIVFVTHDVEEAVYLADRIAIMGARPGHVKQIVDVAIERPRIRTDQHFSEIRSDILSSFGLGVEKSVTEEKQKVSV
ncbi:ABC transporter ATP-binding protein [Halalkalibacter lacteus]|uniref:ABC transporter ATP-binding protein n=1 Tax=Halalkalibacter lacteus TaxID=3090663 RepID=UPI002FCAD1A4